jgi:Legionella pneumophila major outer membrane protein precursor
MRLSVLQSVALLMGGVSFLAARAGDLAVPPPPPAIAPAAPGQLPPNPIPANGTSPALNPPPGPPADVPISHPAQDWLDNGNSLGGSFQAGAGFYLLKPYFSGNAAFTFKSTTSSTAIPGSSTSQSLSGEQDFDYGASVSPLLWLGYTGANGLGVRLRWWHFDQGTGLATDNSDTTGATVVTSASPRGISFESPGHILKTPGIGTDELAFNTDLKIDSWDFEASQAISAGKWALLVSGGVRYAHLAQDYHAYRFNSGVSGSTTYSQDSAALISGSDFNGAGPTLCLEGKRQIGNTGLALYANARGSLLFGRADQQVDKLTVLAGTNTSGPFNTQTFTDYPVAQDRVMPVAELEVGAEYAPELSGPYSRLHPFLRAGLVGQTWFGAGNASGPGSNLGLLGMSVTTGVEF